MYSSKPTYAEFLINTLKHLDSVKCEVIPLNNITDTNNEKEHFRKGIPTGWENQEVSLSTNIKSVNDGGCGFLIKTGKKSNIIAVDYDNKKCTNPEILDMLLKSNTVTIKTPNGSPNSGYHFLYQYDDRLYKGNVGLCGNIDIRSNKGLLFHGSRSDGDYILQDFNTSIKKCPLPIINILTRYVKIPPCKELLNPDNIVLNTHDITVNIPIDTSKYIIDSKSLKDIYSKLDAKYTTEYMPWIIISIISKKEDAKEGNDSVKYFNVWDEWSARNTEKYDKDKNKLIWDALKITGTYCDLSYIIYIVNATIPKGTPKIANIKKLFIEYTPLTISTNPNDYITKRITNKYLNTSLLNSNNDYVFKSGLGTGKTTTAFTYAKEQKLPIISICALTSIIDSHQETYFKITGDELVRYDDKDLIEKYRMSLKTDKPISIVSTIDSINKIRKLLGEDVKHYLVFADEIHSTLEYFMSSQTLNTKRIENITDFSYILENCYKILCADGDVSNNVMSYLKMLNRYSGDRKLILYINSYKSFNNIKCKIEKDENIMITDIFKILIYNNKQTIANKRIGLTVCCNTKSRVQKFKAMCEKKGLNLDNIIFYTSTDGEKITNINKEWSNKCVIYSPSIVQGLDFNPDKPQKVFVFYEGSYTINPLQVAQQICRNRSISEVFIYISKMSNEEPFYSLEETDAFLKNNENTFNSLNKQLMNTQVYLTKVVNVPDDNYSKLYREYEYQKRILLSNCEYNLCELLKNKGFIIVNPDLIDKNIQLILTSEDRKDLKHRILKSNALLFENYINNTLTDKDTKYKDTIDKRLEYFKIPTRKDILLNKPDAEDVDDVIKYNLSCDNHKKILEEHEYIFNDTTAFNSYYAVSLLLDPSKNAIDNAIKKGLKDDYLENLHDSASVKVKGYLAIIDKYLKNDINPLNVCFNNRDNDEKIDISNEHFSFIKNHIRTKEEKPKTKIQLLQLLKYVIRDIFGNDILTKTRTSSKSNKPIIEKPPVLDKATKQSNKDAKNAIKDASNIQHKEAKIQAKIDKQIQKDIDKLVIVDKDTKLKNIADAKIERELKQEQNKIAREADKINKSILKDVKTKDKEAKEQEKEQEKEEYKRQNITTYKWNDEKILQYTNLFNIYKENSSSSKYTPISLCEIVERYDPSNPSNIDIIPTIYKKSKYIIPEILIPIIPEILIPIIPIIPIIPEILIPIIPIIPEILIPIIPIIPEIDYKKDPEEFKEFLDLKQKNIRLMEVEDIKRYRLLAKSYLYYKPIQQNIISPKVPILNIPQQIRIKSLNKNDKLNTADVIELKNIKSNNYILTSSQYYKYRDYLSASPIKIFKNIISVC
jgi:hypothetical protein